MDAALYVAMTGATQLMQAQRVNDANLANLNTVGFRAEVDAQTATPVGGPGLPSRVDAVLAPDGFDGANGTLQTTGNPLDIAVQGDHWIAVQAPDGTEAYTRAGDLHLTANGQLVNAAGHPLLGDSGTPIALPSSTSISIADDGTISVVPSGNAPDAIAQMGRIKVVTAQPSQLERGADGLFHPVDGTPLPAAAGSTITVGALESSNVDPVGALVQMIQISRQFSLQTQFMNTLNQDGQAGTSLLTLSA
ncbi:MAG: flagellar basal body rod protein FlgF [Rhodanobacteraceae bacterium]